MVFRTCDLRTVQRTDRKYHCIYLLGQLIIFKLRWVIKSSCVIKTNDDIINYALVLYISRSVHFEKLCASYAELEIISSRSLHFREKYNHPGTKLPRKNATTGLWTILLSERPRATTLVSRWKMESQDNNPEIQFHSSLSSSRRPRLPTSSRTKRSRESKSSVRFDLTTKTIRELDVGLLILVAVLFYLHNSFTLVHRIFSRLDREKFLKWKERKIFRSICWRSVLWVSLWFLKQNAIILVCRQLPRHFRFIFRIKYLSRWNTYL